MNNEKIKQYEAEMDRNYSGACAVMVSLRSVTFFQQIPFTRHNLYQLYLFLRGMHKRSIEINDELVDEEKEQKQHEIDLLMDEAEQYDMSKMTSDPYYPHRITDTEEMLEFVVKAMEMMARLQKILMC